MSTPSLPQYDDLALRELRARELDWARGLYGWAHSHTYPNGQVLEPVAMLEVDEQHPLPPSQHFNVVQSINLLTTGIGLIANLIVNLTNLLDVGAVEFDKPPRDRSEAASDELASITALIGKLRAHHDRFAGLLAEAGTALHALEPDLERATALDQAAREFLAPVLRELFEDVVEAILVRAGLYGRPAHLDDYARQFQTLVVPDVVATTMTDAAFARMRVAGPNPLLLTRVDALPPKFPVDPGRFEGLTGQTLAAALADARVYLVDYEALANVAPGDQPAGPKYPSAPLALFVLDESRQALRPLAIQCGQTPGNSTPVFYCDDGQSWELAKFHVQSADGNYHELISHLGLTHLLIEIFAVATHRNLAQQHPLFLLLLPHFQGTLFINNAAITALIAPGGHVDKLLAGTIEADWGVVAAALQQLDFNAHMLPNDLAARGVADPASLPSYPYRDDAMLVWQAIHGWVSDYLSIYYNDDAAVREDTELQAWFADLTSPEGGGLASLGEPTPAGGRALTRFSYLVEVVTMVIFTGSAQHATVNFPQLDIMSYTPAMPLAMYAPAPTRVSGQVAADTLLASLPPLQMSLLQQFVGQLLGGVYFTRLGEYDLHQRTPWFGDPRVAEPLSAFQNNLRLVERMIGARNLERPAYTPLLPSRIPQSINI